MSRRRMLGRLIVLVVSIVLSNAAQAQFVRTDGDVFSYAGDRDFEVEIMPGMPPTVSVLAIIDLPIAMYVIYSANRFSHETLGAFQCNKEFTMLKSHSNGLYDVRCVNNEMSNSDDSSILKYDGTLYRQTH